MQQQTKTPFNGVFIKLDYSTVVTSHTISPLPNHIKRKSRPHLFYVSTFILPVQHDINRRI